MDIRILVGFGVASVALFFIGRWAMVMDEKLEDLKRQAIQVAGFCQQQGLPQVSALLISFAVGDYSEIISGLRTTMQDLGDHGNATTALDLILDKQLRRKLETVEGRGEVLAKIEGILNIRIDRAALNQDPVALKKEW